MTRRWRALPPPVRMVLLGDLANACGSGLTVPFLFLFFAQVRGLGAGMAGVAVGAVAAGSLISNVLAGGAVDRWGSRVVLQAGLLVSGVGDLLLLTVHSWAAALASAAVYGAGAGAVFPAMASLLGAATPPAHRPAAFALQYALNNIGLSVGAAVAAALVTFTDPASFDHLYLLDAATFFTFAGWLSIPAIRGRRPARQSPGPTPAGSRGGYRQVLADRAFRRFCVVNGLLVVFAFAQFHAALPGIVGGAGGLSAGHLAVVFAANTVTVSLLQVPILAWAMRRPRTVLIVLGAAAFAACWILVGVARHFGGAVPAVVFAAAAAATMGVGEALLSPALGPIVNDLAPEHLRGRYNAVDTVVLSLGSVVGPALTGVLLAAASVVPLVIVLVIGCAAAAAMAGRLDPPTVAGTEDPAADAAELPAALPCQA